MTWWDFLLDFASNTLATGVGITVGLWIDRQRHMASTVAEARRRNAKREVVAEKLRQRRTQMVALLDRSLELNSQALVFAETEVGSDRHLFVSGLELETWEVLKPQLVKLIDDPGLVARLASHFARLEVFDRMVTQRAQLERASGGRDSLKADIVQLGPELRYKGMLLREDLKFFL